MRVIVTDWRDSTKTKELSLQEYVEDQLDSDDSERIARNVFAAFSRLVEVRAEKEVIAISELSQIVHGYERERELKVKK